MWLTNKNHNNFYIPLDLLATFILFTTGLAQARFTCEQSALLAKLKTAAKEAGLPPAEWKAVDKFDAGVCYEKPCLESALEILSAANFRENPCDQNRWLDFVCNRRVSGPDPQSQVDKLEGKVNDQTLALLDSNLEEDSTNSSKYFLLSETRAFHQQCLNKEERDAEDVRFLLDYTDKFGGWPAFTHEPPNEHKFNWLDMVADQNRLEKQGFTPMLFDISVTSKFRGVLIKIGQLSFSSTTTEAEEEEATTAIDYANMAIAMQSAAELENPANYSQILASVAYMSRFHYRLAEYLMDTDRRIDVYTLTELQDLSDKALEAEGVPQVDWARFFGILFNGTGIDLTKDNDTRIILSFEVVMKIVEFVERELRTEEARVAISNALNLNLVAMVLFETTSIVDDLTVFRCIQESGTRESICLKRVEQIFGHSLSKTYLEKYFNDSEVTPTVHQLVENIKKGYAQRIQSFDWMSNQTKEFLYDKVGSIRVHVGPTEEMRRPGAVEHYYQGLVASKSPSSSYPQNFMTINSWELGKERRTAREMWKKREVGDYMWNDMTFVRGESYYQGVANAFYSPVLNQIQIEGGLIQKPIFGVDLPGFMNYGGLGMILAHEIGHSFDTDGRKYDKGNDSVEHWDAASLTYYNAWVKNISDFGCKIPFKVSSKIVQHYLDPNQTIDEDIADQLGIRISFNSYKAYLRDLERDGKKEKVLPGLKKYSPEELFYMKYANMWCEKPGVQQRFNEALEDHSPDNRRAILPLFQYPEFLQTFSCGK